MGELVGELVDECGELVGDCRELIGEWGELIGTCRETVVLYMSQPLTGQMSLATTFFTKSGFLASFKLDTRLRYLFLYSCFLPLVSE